MRRFKSIIAFVIILIACLMINASNAGVIKPPEVVSGKYIIMMKAVEGIPAGLNTAVSEAGGKIVRTMAEIGVVVAFSEASDFADKITKHKDVKCVIPDLRMQWIPDDFQAEGVTPGDEPLFGLQWNMPAIDAPEAWDVGCTGDSARVAVLDSGIDRYHPDLMSNIDVVYSMSFIPEDPLLPDNQWDIDFAGHGTHVSGIIAAADNAFGVIGVAPDATIIAVKVLTWMAHMDPPGAYGDFSWIINGVLYASTEADADIINMSLGAYFPKSGHVPEGWPPLPAREAAYYLSIRNRVLNFASQQGVTVICATGNNSINLNHDHEWMVLPAQAGNGLAVSATGPLNQENPDTLAFYSNYGTSVIDVAAPGGNIDVNLVFPFPLVYDWVFSTFPGGWAWGLGTSMAAPHVAGVAALIVGQHGGDISPAQVKEIIQRSADDIGRPGVDDFYGRGRINAYNAVSGL